MSKTHETYYLKNLFYHKKGDITEYVSVSGTPGHVNYSHNQIYNLLNWDCLDGYRYFSDVVPLPDFPYIIYEFKQNEHFFTSYSIETHINGEKSFPIEWDVQGTNDLNSEWEILDERNNVTCLSNYSQKKKFAMKTNNYKYIKFTQYQNYYARQFYKNTFAVRKIDFYFFYCSLRNQQCVKIHYQYLILVMISK